MAKTAAAKMKVRWVAFADVEDATYNPRKDLLPGDAEWQQIEASIDEYGQVEPLVLNEYNMRLVGGHQRKKIMMHRGETGADMSIVRIEDEAKEKALNIALNQGGAWDLEKLDRVMQDLNPEGLAVITGFSPDVMQRMRADQERLSALNTLTDTQDKIKRGGPTDESEYRPDDQVNDAWMVTLAIPQDERRLVQGVVAEVKENWGCATTSAAFIELCKFYRQMAEQGAKR